MIIFINGPFGIGKTTTALLLVACLKNAVLFDPEVIGDVLVRVAGKFHKVDDFQEYKLWPILTVWTAIVLNVVCRRSLVIPMTISHRGRWRYIKNGLQSFCRFRAVRLVCSEETLINRILTRPDHLGSHSWCLAHVHDGLLIMSSEEYGQAVNTEGLTPDEVCANILSNI